MGALRRLDKTELQHGKIEGMSLARWYEVSGLVSVGACVWANLPTAALAQASDPSPPRATLGVGGAYLFGLIAGFVIFALREAVATRKAHLAGQQK
jgi:hypothetical protein